MHKQRLVDELSRETGLTKKQTSFVLATLVDLIQEQVKRDKKLTINGFGTFDLGKRAARAGINPQTGKKVKIKARKIPRFRAGSRFKEYVNEV